MTRKQVKALAVTAIIAFLVCSIATLIAALFLYFEVVSPALMSKVLYGVYIGTLLVFSFVCAKIVMSRGLLVGLAIALGVILFSLLHRLIGVEGHVGMSFFIRSAITMLVAVSGAVIGVNTVKR